MCFNTEPLDLVKYINTLEAEYPRALLNAYMVYNLAACLTIAFAVE